jgi:hypothetical protein
MLGAQSPQTDPAGRQSDKSMSGKVTVTGCLQAGVDANSYILNNASKKNESAGSQTATPTPGTPSEMARAENSYTLSTDDRTIDLKSHVGHRIEVTGTLSSGRGHGTSSSSAGAGHERQSQSPGQTQTQDRQHLKVTSVKMISQSCS